MLSFGSTCRHYLATNGKDVSAIARRSLKDAIVQYGPAVKKLLLGRGSQSLNSGGRVN